jgi:hypothetical protein
MILKTRYQMLTAKTLLVVIIILASAVIMKASVYYGVAMPSEEFVIGVP